LLLLAALLTSGCVIRSGGNDQGAGAQDEPRGIDRIAEAVERAIERAREGRKERTGGTDPQPNPTTSLGERSNTDFDYQEYQSTLRSTFGLLEEFWAQAMADLDGRYSRPSRYTYYRSDQGGGPTCGGEAAPPRNAFYCSDGDFIAWDETGLMIPYYVQGGDFAAAFVLAHEFGHAMQVRLTRQETVGVLRELQADCFAGAWAGWVASRGFLEAGDLDEATLAVFSARDVPGRRGPTPVPTAAGSSARVPSPTGSRPA
jgi:predicted metalloprotease